MPNSNEKRKRLTPSAPTLDDLRAIHSHLTDGEIERLDAFFTRWAAIALRLYERVASDSTEYEKFLALTSSKERPSMVPKVDSSEEHI